MNKEHALRDYIEMTKNSWTYGKMTLAERERCISALRWATLFGTYKQRWEQLHGIYYAFLLALGYDSPNWRETEVVPF